MRATLTFSTDTEDILSDVAHVLRRRVEKYNSTNTHDTAAAIVSMVEYATVEQLPEIAREIAMLRSQLAKFDFALEDTMNMLSGYHQALTSPPEETQANDEI